MAYYDNYTNDPQKDWCEPGNSIPLDLSLIDNISLGGIDTKDYPDFSDAFIESADYDGREMTEDEMNWVADEHSEFINETVFNHFY